MTKLAGKLLVLSYNTCDQAMRGKAYGSAKQLGGKCQSGNDATPCAYNMANYLDTVPAAVNAAHSTKFDNFDLVGFQEASRWGRILKADLRLGKGTLQKLTMVTVENVKDASMVSFYNPGTFSAPTHNIKSQCAPKADGQPVGRPIHILVFPEGLIFVNVHNAHGWRFSAVSKRLQQILNDPKNFSDADRTALADYRIVMTGDFNEAGVPDSNTPLTWQPFGSGFATVGIQNPPITCNRADGDWSRTKPSHAPGMYEANRPGDYIFDSAAVAQPVVPPNCPKQLMSDHLPVIAITG